MGEYSAIEWTTDRAPDGTLTPGHTFNGWVGCEKISEACRDCYAEGWARRTGHPELWRGQRRRTSSRNWKEPEKWNRAAAASGRRTFVFAFSLADVFEDAPWCPPMTDWRRDFFELVDRTPALTWLLLTKRPQNVLRMVPRRWLDDGRCDFRAKPELWPANVWVGTTVENQARADERIPHLLKVPAPVRFLSCEPLIGPVVLPHGAGFDGEAMDTIPGIQWVIAGGESSPAGQPARARPSHPDWFRALRDQCAAASVPFHFKQWGEHVEVNPELRDADGHHVTLDPDSEAGAGRWTPGRSVGIALDGRVARALEEMEDGVSYHHVARVGKAAAGRRLDGAEHNGVPR